MRYKILKSAPILFSAPLILSEEPTLIIADTHCPYQNADLLHKALSIAKKRKVKRLLHAGDLIDGAQYNSQAKNEVIYPIETEIKHAASILDTAAQFFEEMVFIPGNHDGYYLKKEKITFDTFIRKVIADNKYSPQIITTEYDWVKYSNLAIIGHPTAYSVNAGEIAAQLADKYNMHALIAHDHLQGIADSKKGYKGISIGGMFVHHTFWYKCRAFSLFPESQLGFVIIKDRHIYLYNEQCKSVQVI